MQYGKKNYDPKSYVYAKDPNTFMNLKDFIKVSKVARYSSKKGKYVSDTFSTNKLGTYKITYTVTAPYGKSDQGSFKFCRQRQLWVIVDCPFFRSNRNDLFRRLIRGVFIFTAKVNIK